MSNKIKVPKDLLNADRASVHEAYNMIAKEKDIQKLFDDLADVINKSESDVMPILIAASRIYRSAINHTMVALQKSHKEMKTQKEENPKPGEFFYFSALLHGLHDSKICIDASFNKNTKELYENTDDVFRDLIRKSLTKEAKVSIERMTSVLNEYLPGFEATHDNKSGASDE